MKLLGKSVFLCLVVCAASTYADPAFVQGGMYVDVQGRWFPKIFLNHFGEQGTHSYVLSRRPHSDATPGVRCIVDHGGARHTMIKEERTESPLFTAYVQSSYEWIKDINEISFWYHSEAEATALSDNWESRKHLFVRVLDERAAQRLLMDTPLCDSVISAKQPALPRERYPVPESDFLVADLGDTGVALCSPKASVAFDLNADGTAERMTWPCDTKSFVLALDRNNNQSIEDGTELFSPYSADAWGNRAPTGFAVLRSFDSNQDGWIDARDGIFEHLRFWNDANQNGQSDAGELRSACELGVAGIQTACLGVHASDDFGNCKTQQASIRLEGGTQHKIYELNPVKVH